MVTLINKDEDEGPSYLRLKAILERDVMFDWHGNPDNMTDQELVYAALMLTQEDADMWEQRATHARRMFQHYQDQFQTTRKKLEEAEKELEKNRRYFATGKTDG